MHLERLAKVIARRGFCSRRAAEILIQEGKVAVAGQLITHASATVHPDTKIEIEGTAVPAAAGIKLWSFYKPVGCLTTNHDPLGRPTVFSLLPRDLDRTISVGRLDYNTEGLLLLCNDGGVARKLELPSSAIKRVYLCKVYGKLPSSMAGKLQAGLTIKGIRYDRIMLKIIKSVGMQHWLELTLLEGKNREIRKICQHFALQVSRLIRIQYANIQLGGMRPGQLLPIGDKLQLDLLKMINHA